MNIVTEERRRAIDQAHVQDDFAARVEDRLDGLITAAQGMRDGRGYLITGPAGSGKSHLINRFKSREELAPYEMETGEGIARPIIYVNAPSPCTLKALGIEILQTLTGTFVRSRLQSHEIWSRVRRQLVANRTRFLVIDEIHHVLQRKNDMEAESIAETFKNVMQQPDWPIFMLLGGISSAVEFSRTYPQFGRRTEVSEIQPVPDNENGYALIGRYVDALVPRLKMPEKFSLAEGDLPLRFHRASDGYPGSVANIVKTAAHLALDYESPVITIDDLAEAYSVIDRRKGRGNPFRDDPWSTSAFGGPGEPRDMNPSTSRRSKLRGSGEHVGAAGTF